MRTIINISLSKELGEVVNRAVKRGKFSTKSEFFRNLVRMWEERKLVVEFNKNRKDFESGGGKLLRSLKDLD